MGYPLSGAGDVKYTTAMLEERSLAGYAEAERQALSGTG
jgi:hypothetical protein